jgi:uncharacterized protein DUF3800
VTLIEAYFDESGSHDGSHALCVAGYLFEKKQCEALDLGWKTVLDQFSLPYFHMVDCAHGNDPFDKLSKDERIAAEKLMIGLIRKHMAFGSAITVDENDYNTWGARQKLGTAYTYCCWQSLAGMQVWLNQNSFEGKVSYFFEAGHKHQAEANEIMNRIFKDVDLRQSYRYSSHSFVDKKLVRPIQAPDIFAWLHWHHFERLRQGIAAPRKDFVALVEGLPYKMFIANRETVSPALVSGDFRDDPQYQAMLADLA